MSAPSSSSDVIEPSDLDILCGKDKRCQVHKGTLRFRLMIQSYQQSYLDATTKQLRMAITKEIYSIFHQSNSRFLKFNDLTRQWEEISPLAARDKISHALRGSTKKGGKREAVKARRGHRRNNSDFSEGTVDSSIYSEATEYSWIDELVNPSLNKGSSRPDGFPGDVHLTRVNDDTQVEDQEEMEPLPADVTVDLSFLLQESSINLKGRADFKEDKALPRISSSRSGAH